MLVTLKKEEEKKTHMYIDDMNKLLNNELFFDIEKGPISDFKRMVYESPGEYGDNPYSFEYKLNSHGFRSIEFNSNYDVLTAGCSITYGVGIPADGMWSNILSNISGLKVANISYPGKSTDTIIKNIVKLLKMNKPKIIICFFPNFERCNVVENSSIHPYNVGNESFHYKKGDSIKTILPMEWARENAYNHISILENICSILNIKLIWSTWSLSNLEFNNELEKFNDYVADITINDFPKYKQWNTWTEDENKRRSLFIHSDMNCHANHPLSSSKYFYYGGDSAKRISDLGEGFCPHPGIHRNIHWAEFFYDRIKNIC